MSVLPDAGPSIASPQETMKRPEGLRLPTRANAVPRGSRDIESVKVD